MMNQEEWIDLEKSGLTLPKNLQNQMALYKMCITLDDRSLETWIKIYTSNQKSNSRNPPTLEELQVYLHNLNQRINLRPELAEEPWVIEASRLLRMRLDQ